MGMIGQASATLWMVVHSVQGIMFKDLKQISCTKCITIHRVIVLQIAQFLAQADILVNFFCQYYSGLFDNSLKYFLQHLFFISGMEMIGQALATLWMVVHSVQGIMFKDLKQILRKEQVDASILLTANVPAAKKIIVHGPQG